MKRVPDGKGSTAVSTMPHSTYDAVIVGGGIAGLSAAIHAGRSGLRCLLVERMMPGGQIFNATHVENMPGIAEPLSGVELSERLHDQVAQAGVEIALSEVTGLEPDGPHWLVRKYDGDVRGKAVIIAAGSSFKKLGLDREDEFYGSGISNCASCDGPLFNDQVVGVVGGGDSALDEAIALTEFASKVIIFHRDAELDGQAILRQRVQADPQDRVAPQYRSHGAPRRPQCSRLYAPGTPNRARPPASISLASSSSSASSRIPASSTESSPSTTRDTSRRGIWMRTPARGIFAIGDIRQNSAALLASSAGDGATAAVAAKRYIHAGHWPD